MPRLAAPYLIFALALAGTQANAQAGAPPPPVNQEGGAPPPASDQPAVTAPSVAVEVCPTLEQAAADNGLPVQFFVRVIWQESRFNALAVSSKGAHDRTRVASERCSAGS